MRLGYRISHTALRGLFGGICRWEVKGTENLPTDGGVIVVANHRSNFDPPILGATLNREIHYMAKEELFENFLMERLMRYFGAFPVKRGSGDMGAIKQAFKLLRAGKMLGLFPEGTRNQSDKLKRAKPGIVLIATKAEVPILPVGLMGTESPFKKELKLNIGNPFKLEGYYGKKLTKTELKEAGRLIMSKIAKELER